MSSSTTASEESAASALEVFLNDMRYINSRFTYLLTADVAEFVHGLRTFYATQLSQGGNSGVFGRQPHDTTPHCITNNRIANNKLLSSKFPLGLI